MFNWLKSSKSQQAKTLGQIGEELAQEEYKKRGYKIIAANFFNPKGLRLGEVDFIAKNKSEIVFVEVKTRTGAEGRFGTGAEAVDVYKQRKLLKAVKVFLEKNQEYQDFKPQIDVCVVQINEVDPVKPADLSSEALAKGEGRAALQLVNRVDNHYYSVIIIPNAVEDWN